MGITLEQKLLSQKLRYVKAKVAAEKIAISAQKARLRHTATVGRNSSFFEVNEAATALEESKWSKWRQETKTKLANITPEIKESKYVLSCFIIHL